MKLFDYIVGNPPYQQDSNGDNENDTPLYHYFYQEAYSIADKVELITPARFLFNAGATPKDWNEKMLSDEHLKILFYEVDSSKIFPNTDIKGGVAITCHDVNKKNEAIKIFTPFPELNSTLKKVQKHGYTSLSDIIVSRTAYRLTDKMHEDYPEAIKQLSQGHAYDMSSNIFTRIPQVFFDEKPNDEFVYIRIIGLLNGKRVFKYIRTDYVKKQAILINTKLFYRKRMGAVQ